MLGDELCGNPTKQQTTRGGTDTYDVYAYDTRNRLTDSCFGVSSGTTTCSGATNAINYSYDKVSNRTQEIRSGSVGNTGTIDYAYNGSDQLTGTTKSGTTTSYTYDANGNTASAGSKSFTYGLADRLVSATSGGTTTTYAYDGDGRRVSASASGGTDLRFVWDPLADSGVPELSLERTGAGTFVRSYLNGPAGAIGFTNSSASFYYHQDPLETVTDVTNASGAAQWKYEYEAYGGERSATDVSGSAPVNKLRFQGQYLDGESTLYHLRARQYDPATGRFGALDSVEPASDMAYDSAYGYVNARPTVLVDPLGLCGWRDPLGCGTDSLRGLGDLGAAAYGATQTVGEHIGRKAADAYAGRGGGFDGALAAIDALNPIAGIRHNAVVGYREEGGGFRGVLEGFNRGLNPMYYALIHTDQCVHAGDDRTRAIACAQAAVDIASLGFAAGAAARCLAAIDRDALQAMLADETGSVRPFARVGEAPLPTLDRRGKIHGALPGYVPKTWTQPDLEELAADLRASIRTRQNEQLRLGEHGPHQRRIAQEMRLLRQIDKALSGS